MSDNNHTNPLKWEQAFDEALNACKDLQAQVEQLQCERDDLRRRLERANKKLFDTWVELNRAREENARLRAILNECAASPDAQILAELARRETWNP